MAAAYSLLKVESGKSSEVEQALADMEGIAEVHAVSGGYDLVAIIDARSNEELAKLVKNDMPRVEGVLESETLVDLRVRRHHEPPAVRRLGFPV